MSGRPSLIFLTSPTLFPECSIGFYSTLIAVIIKESKKFLMSRQQLQKDSDLLLIFNESRLISFPLFSGACGILIIVGSHGMTCSDDKGILIIGFLHNMGGSFLS